MNRFLKILSLVALTFSLNAHAQTTTPQTPMQEAKKMLGTTPIMLNYVPEGSLQGAWDNLKNLQLNPNTALSGKNKELIGAAVAAQIPCRYCSYFHERAATQLNQANQNEVREAIAIAALTRQWSAVLNGFPQDQAAFRRDLNRMFSRPMNRQTSVSQTGSTSSATTADTASMTMAKTADDVYKDAKRIWGFVPQFIMKYPKESVAGAWNQFKSLEMATTAIPAKIKSLISLAVASQVPCSYCVEMDTRSAKAAGASDREISEAVAMAANTRHWSTILNGNMIDENEFKANTDSIIGFVKNSANKPAETRSSTTEPATEPATESN